jgi:hypothetical protein
MSGHLSSLTSEDLLEQYGYYLNKKIQLSEVAIRALVEEVKRRSWKEIRAGEVMRILHRTRGIREPIMRIGAGKKS